MNPICYLNISFRLPEQENRGRMLIHRPLPQVPLPFLRRCETFSFHYFCFRIDPVLQRKPFFEDTFSKV